MISEFEKYIYNLHLKATRQHNNKPFKIRKDFDGIEPQQEKTLKKLSLFFSKHKDIDPVTFFNASYKIYPDETYLNLDHFISLKAIKAFTIHNKNIVNLEPDSEEQLQFTKASLLYIYNFCLNNNIFLKAYTEHRTNNLYSFLIHLKNRDINFYSLMGFSDLNFSLNSSDLDIIKFMFNDSFLDNIQKFKIKFLNSNKCKNLVVNGLQRLEKKLENELNSNKASLLS